MGLQELVEIKNIAGAGKMTDNLLEEIKLRKFIRKVIRIREKKILRERKKIMLEEQDLRKVVRHLLFEAEVDADTEPAPYQTTALNSVWEVFSNVLSPIKKTLRTLTDGGEERTSYRDHIYSSFYDLFRSLGVIQQAGESEAPGVMAEEKISINVKDEPEEKFEPDVEDPDEPTAKPSKEEEAEEEFKKFAITGKDATGARFAHKLLNNSNIENTLQEFHRNLGDANKRKQFEEYFMYNLDLFMIKYEKQLAGDLGQEPTFTEPVIPKPEGAVVRDPEGPAVAGEPTEPAETVGAPVADEELPELPKI
jgi:hypothetical protein